MRFELISCSNHLCSHTHTHTHTQTYIYVYSTLLIKYHSIIYICIDYTANSIAVYSLRNFYLKHRICKDHKFIVQSLKSQKRNVQTNKNLKFQFYFHFLNFQLHFFFISSKISSIGTGFERKKIIYWDWKFLFWFFQKFWK